MELEDSTAWKRKIIAITWGVFHGALGPRKTMEGSECMGLRISAET